MTEKLAKYDAHAIGDMILTVRRQRVILDTDLAVIYGVETKVLNQAVKRNMERFPADFVFRLTPQEVTHLKLQIVTSSSGAIRSQFAIGFRVREKRARYKIRKSRP